MGLFNKIVGGNTLFYPGCLMKFVAKDLAENYRKILRKAGIDFIELKDLEVCCGSPVASSGYTQDAKALADKNLKIFKDHAVKKIITSCPACFRMFSQEYPKIVKWDIQVEHVTQTILDALAKGKLKLNKANETITYHDPCHLGRYCKVYDEPRKILEDLGFKIVEMKFNKENAFCCGGGGGLKANYPKLSEAVAKDRVQQAKETGAKVLVTTCPLCYLHMKETEGIEVKELSQLIMRLMP